MEPWLIYLFLPSTLDSIWSFLDAKIIFHKERMGGSREGKKKAERMGKRKEGKREGKMELMRDGKFLVLRQPPLFRNCI